MQGEGDDAPEGRPAQGVADERARPRGFGAAEPPPPREPFTRAPWPALALCASILILFGVQSALGDVDGWNERFGLHPQALFSGHDLGGLFTALWSHASWTHAGLNAVFALAFGAPVARMFGAGLRGAALFAAFYLLGGVLASIGFAAVHPGGGLVLVGASGAIAALTGAAIRLIGSSGVGAARAVSDTSHRVRLAPLTSAGVLGMTLAFVASNLLLGLFGVDLGQGDAPLAWEAHIAGYLAGLLLIGPFSRLARATPPQSAD